MNTLAVAILFVAVAYTTASIDARGALEGALGGQWIPDVPVAGHGVGIIGAPAVGLGVGPVGLAGAGLGWGGAGLGWGGAGLGLGAGLGWGAGIAGHGVSRGAVEGALGGQWIPDTHGK
ncbi:hypothetical protein JTB14_027530 [Gonioctena quinquepunctata]|nr:hypothetical protein JTB14_027530 [Gonioctena quinquepunctata]